jgi:exodeoxyribonuclease III
MKIATWNVNSIAIRLEQVLKWLETTQTDVLCLQETKCVDEKFPLEAFNDAGYSAAFMGQKSYNGVAILSKHPISDVQYNFPDDDADAPKRLIAATVENIRIVNTYIPNGTELWTDKFTFKLDWLQRLRRLFDATCAVIRTFFYAAILMSRRTSATFGTCLSGKGNCILQSPNVRRFITSNNGGSSMFSGR